MTVARAAASHANELLKTRRFGIKKGFRNHPEAPTGGEYEIPAATCCFRRNSNVSGMPIKCFAA